jgi:hypothetical protein
MFSNFLLLSKSGTFLCYTAYYASTRSIASPRGQQATLSFWQISIISEAANEKYFVILLSICIFGVRVYSCVIRAYFTSLSLCCPVIQYILFESKHATSPSFIARTKSDVFTPQFPVRMAQSVPDNTSSSSRAKTKNYASAKCLSPV